MGGKVKKKSTNTESCKQKPTHTVMDLLPWQACYVPLFDIFLFYVIIPYLLVSQLVGQGGSAGAVQYNPLLLP